MLSFIIPTSQAEYLVENILKKNKDFEIVSPVLSRDGKRYFPDGEVYVKIPNPNKLKEKQF